MGDRAVYCARLESVCAERHPGFESPPIRQMPCLVAGALEMIAGMRLAVVLLILLVCLPLALAEERASIGDNRLNVARQDLESGDLKAAQTAIDQFEQANKSNVESLDLRGVLYMEQGRLGEAAKAFENAHKADPTVFGPRLHAGDLLLRQKRFQPARDAYEILLKEANVSTAMERLRFGILITYLGARDDEGARAALGRIGFPTQTPAYYYAQAAWSFAHGKSAEGHKWIKAAAKIFPARAESWFARPFYELGWTKEKPAPATN